MLKITCFIAGIAFSAAAASTPLHPQTNDPEIRGCNDCKSESADMQAQCLQGLYSSGSLDGTKMCQLSDCRLFFPASAQSACLKVTNFNAGSPSCNDCKSLRGSDAQAECLQGLYSSGSLGDGDKCQSGECGFFFLQGAHSDCLKVTNFNGGECSHCLSVSVDAQAGCLQGLYGASLDDNKMCQLSDCHLLFPASAQSDCLKVANFNSGSCNDCTHVSADAQAQCLQGLKSAGKSLDEPGCENPTCYNQTTVDAAVAAAVAPFLEKSSEMEALKLQLKAAEDRLKASEDAGTNE